jgi:hypothetical protein
VRKTHGDRYAAAWCSQAFEKRKVEYKNSELPRSGLYLNLLPHLNGKTIRLLDSPRAVNQIASLERRTSRGGKDTVDYPPSGHDDIANAIAGLAYVAINRYVAAVPQFGVWGLCNNRFGSSVIDDEQPRYLQEWAASQRRVAALPSLSQRTKPWV